MTEKRREWRACVADGEGLEPEDYTLHGTRQEARDGLARLLAPDYAEPPYEVGWVEWRDVTDWQVLASERLEAT